MKKLLIFKIIAALVLLAAVIILACMIGCGIEVETVKPEDKSCKQILTMLVCSANTRFPAYGGNYEKYIDGMPESIDVTDSFTLKEKLLVPEDILPNIKEAATFFHYMNTNTFSSAVLKTDFILPMEAAKTIADSFADYPFIDGMPDKIAVYTLGDKIMYFYGNEVFVDAYMIAATHIDGATLYKEVYRTELSRTERMV